MAWMLFFAMERAEIDMPLSFRGFEDGGNGIVGHGGLRPKAFRFGQLDFRSSGTALYPRRAAGKLRLDRDEA